MSQPFIWAALRLMGSICSSVPHNSAVKLGGRVGHMVGRACNRKRTEAVNRCSEILSVSRKEAESIVMASYINMGKSAAEMLSLLRPGGVNLRDMVHVDGLDNLDCALRPGKGVIFITAHLGNWEYGAGVLGQMGYPMSAIGAEQRDKRITGLIERLRLMQGVQTVGKGPGDLKSAIQCLKSGRCLGILMDQDAREKGVVSDFLGHPASTPVGPVKLAGKLGSAVVPSRLTRHPDGIHHTLKIYPALVDSSGIPFGRDEQASTDMCNSYISSWIRGNPGEWMWMYPRWATTGGP